MRRIRMQMGLDEKIAMTEMYAIDFVASKVKNHFGKEYLFQKNDSKIEVIFAVIEKFIKKYDKNYEKHIQNEVKGETHMLNVMFVCKLDKQTFMYVASGNKIAGGETRLLTNNAPSPDDLYIYIFGKHTYKYTKEIDKLIHNVYCSAELGIFTIDAANTSRRGSSDTVSESVDVVYTKMALRSLDTIFFSDSEKEKITNHIDKFNDNETFYTEKQLLYKTGILLYGEPGTGKSSLIKALATQYNRSIANINVSNLKYIDLTRVTQAINIDEERKYIILLEDIDTLFLNRTNGESSREDQAIINKLLQFLDSNTSPNNVIFIATTNHIDRLDPALLREGRFDLKVEVKPLLEKDCYIFGDSFGLSRDVMHDIIDKIYEENPERTRINQSLLQARILSKRENKSQEQIDAIYREAELKDQQPQPTESYEEKVSEYDLMNADENDEDDN